MAVRPAAAAFENGDKLTVRPNLNANAADQTMLQLGRRNNILSTEALTIYTYEQQRVFDGLTIDGSVVVDGAILCDESAPPAPDSAYTPAGVTDTVPSGDALAVAVGSQLYLFDGLTVDGMILIDGAVECDSPAAPAAVPLFAPIGVRDTINAGEMFGVDQYSQVYLFNFLTVDGEISIDGRVGVTA